MSKGWKGNFGDCLSASIRISDPYRGSCLLHMQPRSPNSSLIDENNAAVCDDADVVVCEERREMLIPVIERR